MTVKDLRKALKGIKGNVPVYLRDHDNPEYGTSAKASCAKLMNQNDMGEYWKKRQGPIFKIKGNYFIISG